jgi:hypothetical protein
MENLNEFLRKQNEMKIERIKTLIEGLDNESKYSVFEFLLSESDEKLLESYREKHRWIMEGKYAGAIPSSKIKICPHCKKEIR